MNQFDTKMTKLADAIKAKNSSVSGKLSIQDMIDAVDGIAPGGGGADVSGVTATPADVLAGKQFVNADGELVDGEIQTAGDPIILDNVVKIPAGYRAEAESVTVGKVYEGDKTYTPGREDTILKRGTFIKTMLQIKGDRHLEPDNIRYGVNIFGVAGTFSEDGNAEAEDILEGKAAYVKGEKVYGSYRPPSLVDLSFVTAGASDILEGKVGADANGSPVYGTLQAGGGGGSSECQFYICTGYDGVVEKIIITAGAITDDMDEPVSLVGEYNIVDPAAVGTARKWYCPQTSASGDYPAYNYGVTIGCAEIEVDWNDDGPVYERKWGIASGTSVDDMCWLIAPTSDIESPFDVNVWQNNGGYVAVTPVLTSAVPDAEPYGPTGWKGRPIVMTDNPVMISYGAGVASANGFWEQTAGNGLTPDAEWRILGSDTVIINEHPDHEYQCWTLKGYDAVFSKSYTSLYWTNYDTWTNDTIKHPVLSNWSGSSSYNPVPTFVYSERGGYFPSDTIVSGLIIKGKAPEIGGFYNADATIKAEIFFPA